MSNSSRLPDSVHGDAVFSPDRRYRYWLERRWDTSLPRFTYVLLNPSGADARSDDRTNQRLCGMTAAHGGGGYELVNLFALVDTGQEHLTEPGAIGEAREATDKWIVEAVGRAQVVVLGWGDGNGKGTERATRTAIVRQRAGEVLSILGDVRPRCFAVNASGAPKHPLYVKTTAPLVPYAPGSAYGSDRT